MKNKKQLTWLAVLFWLLIWQLGAMGVNRSLLLPIPTPISTVTALVRLMQTASFWNNVGLSLIRICSGFLIAVILGCLGAIAAWYIPAFDLLTAPLLKLIRSIPVASFIILVFLWLPRDYIPTFISFLTVLPVVWSNMEQGLKNTDIHLQEMAEVFGMTPMTQLRIVLLPQLKPYFSSAVTTGLGFAWKSGVAAEVICRTVHSLGNMLWEGKSAIDYDEVFAVTVVIVALSVLFEQLSKRLLKGGRR